MTTLVREQPIESRTSDTAGSPGLRQRLQMMTVGGALAGAILVLAALVRLFALGGRPLDAAEAARALTALHFVQGQPADLTSFSPLLTNLNLLVFFLAGASDFWARLVPALFGIALAVLPAVQFRHRLGTVGALAASVFVAFSSTFLLFSRSVDPGMLSAVTSLVFVRALFDFVDRHERRDLLIAAGALALALTAGLGIYTVLLFLLIFSAGAWLFQRYRGASGWERLVVAFQALRRDSEIAAQAGAVFGVTLIIAATGFLVNFGGVQATLNQFVRWLSAFSFSREYPIWYYAGTLALYEPAILLFGLVGAAMALRRRDFFGVFLVTWFVGGLLLYTLVGATKPSLVVSILLPLALLAGWGVAAVFEFAQTDEALRALLVAAFVVPLFVYAMLQLTFYAEVAARSTNLFLALGAVAMALIVAVVFASSQFGMAWQPATVARGVGMGVLLLSLALTLHMTWQLNFVRHNPVRELLRPAPTSSDAHQMVSVLETLSQNRVEDTVSIPITVDGRLAPVVPWYLREFTNVNVVDEVHQPPGTPIVIMPATDQNPSIGDQYVGQGFRLTSRWRPTGLTASEFARWYFFREGAGVPEEELILFVARR